MKKLLISVLVASSFVYSAFAFTVSPTSGTKIVGDTINIAGAGGIDNFTEYYSWWTTGNIYVAGSETLFHLNANAPVPSTPGTYKLRLTSFPTGGSFPVFPDFTSGTFTIIAPIYGCTNPLAENYNPSADTDNGSCIVLTGIEKMVKNASSTFSATTGFSPGESVSSVGNIFIKPIIGGGLMLFTSLLPWIIALIVLSAFVFFAYRAFRFYKH
jgi:hypothetical protein